MILVGQYDSPYTRRVAISLMVLGIPYEHDTRSVFGDFDSMRKTNPLGRIPSLILDDGTVLIDSAAILDWIDEKVQPWTVSLLYTLAVLATGKPDGVMSITLTRPAGPGVKAETVDLGQAAPAG